MWDDYIASNLYFKLSELDYDQVQMSSVLSLIYLGIVNTAIAL